MRTIEWQDGTVVTIDQTRLPHETVTLRIETIDTLAEAIKSLRIRGAPLLGAAAAFGMALTAHHSEARSLSEMQAELENTAVTLKSTRPTAVNLFWAIDRILNKSRNYHGSIEELRQLVVNEAQRIADEDADANRAIGENG